MKVFLLGVGAQKAGTTWLHDYLAQAPEADFGFFKEYHVFDTLTLPACANFAERITKGATQELGKPPEQWGAGVHIRRAAFVADPELYFDYFARLLNRDGIRLTGDITPSYSGLSEETLCQIRDGFARRGITVRPVFLMRDPVQRIQSMVRMNFRDREVSPTYEQECRMIRRKLQADGALMRTDYGHTVTALDKVFGAEAFYEFYEQLFTESAIRRLCTHLDIGYRPPNFDERKNVSRTDNDLTPKDWLAFAKEFRTTFAFCCHRFSTQQVEALWKTPPRKTVRAAKVPRARTKAAKGSGRNRSSETAPPPPAATPG